MQPTNRKVIRRWLKLRRSFNIAQPFDHLGAARVERAARRRVDRAGRLALEADVGEGKLYMFLPEVLYRGQPHETFKFVFNGIYLSTAREATAN